MPARSTLSLDGLWRFETDPRGLGLTDHWQARRDFAQEVAVPSPWQLYGPELVGYTGYAWYQRDFDLPEDFGGRQVVVHFDAVDYEARVWLNGHYLGAHEGGYTPFEFVVDAALDPGATQHLVLRVYDPKDNSEIPHGKQGSWYTRVSGPWQPVTLEARDAVHVKGLWITPDPKAGLARVRVAVDAPEGAPVHVDIVDPQGALINAAAAHAASGEVQLEIAIPDPALWSPESPVLYQARATVGEDTRTAAFGMRWVSYENSLIHLNGQPLYIRGALDQAFYPETVYRVPSVAAIDHEIALAKAMGLNMLRKHIKLEDPRYLDACDRLGMLIWEEPACFYKYSPQAKARFKREIEAMIDRDYNHPSIIAWSLYNEEWGLEWRLWKDDEKQAHVEALYDHAKALDPTRLICDNSGWAHVKTDLNDWHRYFTAPDLIDEWRADLTRCVESPETNFVASRQHNAKDVPVLVSEFGVWGLTEPSKITDWYQGRPWWFDAQWAGHTEEFKYPATAERNFQHYALKPVFGSLDGLAQATQQRMMRALKPLIEEMRWRADLAGYIVTEFTDIEWESNGWLDYFRKPKAQHEQFGWFNGATVVMARLESHNVWAGETVSAELMVSNHTARSFEGQVTWQVAGHPGLGGRCDVMVAPHGNTAAGSFSFTAPDVTGATALSLTLSLAAEGRTHADNAYELTVTSRALSQAEGLPPVFLVGEACALAGPLREAGVPIAAALSRDTLVLTSLLDAATQAHLEAGGLALFVAEHGDMAEDKGFVSFRRLPRGESWDRASSVMYARPEVFGDLPIGSIFGWETAGLYPHHVIPLSAYLHDFGGRGIELPSNQAQMDPEGILAGYFEGWLGKFAATLVRLPYGQGTLTATTWRLLENYGRQPIGTAMLLRLLVLASRPLREGLGRRP